MSRFQCVPRSNAGAAMRRTACSPFWPMILSRRARRRFRGFSIRVWVVTDRVTLITGASAGIGSELARIFAAKGHRVVLTARREERLKQLATEIVAAGGTH